MTCPNMGCYQGEGSRKGHKVSRQNNYKVRHEKWALPGMSRALPGTSRRCATYSPPPESIFRPRNILWFTMKLRFVLLIIRSAEIGRTKNSHIR